MAFRLRKVFGTFGKRAPEQRSNKFKLPHIERRGRNRKQWPVSRKSRKPFGAEKPCVKLRTANSAKLVFHMLFHNPALEAVNGNWV